MLHINSFFPMNYRTCFIVLFYFFLASFSFSYPTASSSPVSISLNSNLRQAFQVIPILSQQESQQEIHVNISDPHHFILHQKTSPAKLSVASFIGCSNVDFSAPVYVNGQGPFNLVVDTGSSVLGVASRVCACQQVTPTFDTTGSSNAVGEGGVFVEYADGKSWHGAGWDGQVSIGDSQAISMIFASIDTQTPNSNGAYMVQNSSCGLSSNARRNWNQGIIGFAYPVLAGDTDSFFFNYAAQTGIPNEFSISMCSTPNDLQSGNLWLGGFDPDWITGQFAWIPITKQAHFSTYLTEIDIVSSSGIVTPLQDSGNIIGPRTYGQCADGTEDSDCVAIDSGTSLIKLPRVAYLAAINTIPNDAYYQSIFGNNGPFNGNCPSTSSLPSKNILNANLPTLSFKFASSISGSDSVTVSINAIDGYLITTYSDTNHAYYCSGLDQTGASAPGAILGFAFMNQFITRHDIGNSLVGMARIDPGRCGTVAPPLKNYYWSSKSWSTCSLSCGGGQQWREINCTDANGVVYADIVCTNNFAGPKLPETQMCNIGGCPSSTTTFTSLTLTTNTINPGTTYPISFTYNGNTPSAVTIYVTPQGITTTLPYYVIRNASTISPYNWLANNLIPAGNYLLSVYGDNPSNSYTYSTVISITACSGLCGGDPCATFDAACNNRGQCTGNPFTATPNCVCIAGYSGPTCNIAPAITGCSLICQNGGTVNDLNLCNCNCPPNFSGTLCQYRYATVSATMNLDPNVVGETGPGHNQDVFKAGLSIDIAYVLGIPSKSVAVTRVQPSDVDGSRTAAYFLITVPWNTATLTSSVNNLETVVTLSGQNSIKTGMMSYQTSAIATVNLPPPDSSKGNSDTGTDIYTEFQSHLTVIFVSIGVALFVCLGVCMLCLRWQRRETNAAFQSSRHERARNDAPSTEKKKGEAVMAAPRDKASKV